MFRNYYNYLFEVFKGYLKSFKKLLSMYIIMENKDEINYKTCKICCMKQSETVKFQKNRRTCIKCNSRKCNEKLGNEYFRLKMVGRYVKLGGKAGRPSKETKLQSSL